MELKYKIVSIDETEHSAVVRFYTDVVTEEMLATERDAQGNITRTRTDYHINLPHPLPADDELHDFFLRHAPVQWFHLKEKIADPNVDTSLARLRVKVGSEKSQGVVIEHGKPPRLKK